MLTKFAIITLAFAFATQGYAQLQPQTPQPLQQKNNAQEKIPRSVRFVDRSAEYQAITPATMEAGKVYHSQKIIGFNQWRAESPEESQLLNRYPTFAQQKTVRVLLDGVNEYLLLMYLARTKFTVNKPANQIDLSTLANIETMQRVDPSFVDYKQITTAQTMPELQKDKWGYTNPPDHKWCEGNTLCLQNRYKFGAKFKTAIVVYNTGFKDPERPPHQIFIDMQTEIYTLAAARINSGPYGAILQRLTGIAKPPQSVMVQTSFYASDFFEFAKTIVVVQENPDRPGTSIVTTLYAISLKEEMLKKAKKHQDATGIDPLQVIIGNSPSNGRHGPDKGLGPYTTDLSKALHSLLTGIPLVPSQQ